MTDMDQSHVPRAVATVTEVAALKELIESEILAVRDLLATKVQCLHERLDLMNQTGLKVVETADTGLRSEVQAGIIALRNELMTIQQASTRAVDKAEGEMNQKLAVMNEFRGALSDQAGHFATREIVEQLRARVDVMATREALDDLRERGDKYATKDVLDAAGERLGKLELFQSNIQGRMWAMGALIFFGALLLNLVLRFMFQTRGP